MTPNWDPVDLDAIRATVNFGPGPPVVFGQTVTADANKSTFRWPSSGPVPRRCAARSCRPRASGAYAINSTISGNRDNFCRLLDAGRRDSGSWYLVKAGGCAQTSWQSTLGLEPGRDASIP